MAKNVILLCKVLIFYLCFLLWIINLTGSSVPVIGKQLRGRRFGYRAIWERRNNTIKVYPIRRMTTLARYYRIPTRNRTTTTTTTTSKPETSMNKNKKTIQDDWYRQANELFLEVRRNCRCVHPRPEVVSVQSVHNDPSIEFLPKCTILHRCSESTGCCDAEGYTCGPRAVQQVVQYFYVFNSLKDVHVNLDNKVVALTFENHTECECQLRNDSKKIDENFSLNASQIPNEIRKCGVCPNPFSQRHDKGGHCTCDCFHKQRPCLKIKKGKIALDSREHRCVETGRCLVPSCEFGRFNIGSGHCPLAPHGHPEKELDKKPTHHNRHLYERD